MPIQAVLFDLDGTLIDSLADIAGSANTVLAALGHPTHPASAYRTFIGDGVAMLFRRALPESAAEPAEIERCIAGFHDDYARRWDRETRPYRGIPELLDALVARGFSIAVLSNKPQDFTALCVERLLPGWPFRAVVGDRPGQARKPDPGGALAIAAELAIAPADFVYVGDSSVDMRTAVGAGMVAVGVTWGFRSADELRQTGANHLIELPGELLPLLDRLEATDGRDLRA